MMTRSILTMAGVLVLSAGSLFAQAKQPQPKSQAEADAVMKIFNATDPDGRIAAAEELVTKFADTEFKAIAWQVAAASAQQKNDFEKMVVYAERTLEADPENYSAMLMLASGLAQRTREHDLDKEEKLKRAEDYANKASELLKTAQKPREDITDQEWEAARKDFLAQAHESLGLVAMVRKKYDAAANEFKTATEISSQPDQATMVRLAAAHNLNNKPDEALPVLEKLMAMPDLHPQIKQVAESEKVKAMKLKSGEAKVPTPGEKPAPAQVEIKPK
ncbi:MAG: hypothetical protein ACRD7E_27130 [Bryobacteraceae bacterium]